MIREEACTKSFLILSVASAISVMEGLSNSGGIVNFGGFLYLLNGAIYFVS